LGGEILVDEGRAGVGAEVAEKRIGGDVDVDVVCLLLWKWMANSRRAGDVGETAKAAGSATRGSGAWKGGEVGKGLSAKLAT
jgi:hypothetical protein